MAGPSFEEWIQQLGLQRIDDPHFHKPVYRKATFDEFHLSADIERKISATLNIILAFLRHLKTKPPTSHSNGHDGAAQAAPSFSATVRTSNGRKFHGGR